MLWGKLQRKGLSSKVIKILQSLYSSVNIRIGNSDGISDPIYITKGVLQGEILSSILFSIFIANLEDFLLKKKYIRGVSINHLVEILLLAYADDIVILAESYIHMKRIIEALYEYCVINKLSVNTKKTKVIIFRKGGRRHKQEEKKFMFGDSSVEIVKEYVYLGVTFSQTESYESHTKKIVSKAKAACSSTLALIHRIHANSCKVYDDLFGALVQSILLYGTEVYSLRHLDSVEKIQLGFFKKLMNLPQCTPSYAVRRELRLGQYSLLVFKQVIRWINKILRMEDDRYPKICFLRQLHLSQYKSAQDNVNYNWVVLVKKMFFEPIDRLDLWNETTPGEITLQEPELLEKYKEYLSDMDGKKVAQSSSLIMYNWLQAENKVQEYLKASIPLKILKVTCQYKLANSYYTRIIVDSRHYKISEGRYCNYCSEVIDVGHLTVSCRELYYKRVGLKLPLLENVSLDIHTIFSLPIDVRWRQHMVVREQKRTHVFVCLYMIRRGGHEFSAKVYFYRQDNPS
nr:uncharacterized protein LOC124220588 isoform X2 [Neodiprion pinetum]